MHFSEILEKLKPMSPEKIKHDYFNSFLKSKRDIEKYLSIPISEANILIIGCGYKYPDVILFDKMAKKCFWV